MREEGHHHLVFANQYVNVFFVEIPAHETTLLHHHDFPYVSVPPGGADAAPSPAGSSGTTSTSNFARVAYALGNFSHAVTNSSDVTLRNVAVELVRPQGTVRIRCAAVLRDQPLEICDPAPEPTAGSPARETPLFETDEILVQSWELGPNSTITPASSSFDTLICGVGGVVMAAGSARAPDDPAIWIRGGILWLTARSKTVFTMGPNGGHFIVILFKDGTPMRDSE